MKKFYYSLFAAATMLLATTSCSDDTVIDSGNHSVDDTFVTFQLNLTNAAQSRAAGEGNEINQLYYAVYEEDGTTKIIPNQASTKLYECLEFTKGQTTIEMKLPLINGEKYDFIFWAQSSNAQDVYKFNATTGLKEISVNYDNIANNRENLDAFFNSLQDYKVASNRTHTIELRRPFAQLNVGTTTADWQQALAVNNDKAPVKTSMVTVTNLASKFNPVTGEASQPVDVTFNSADITGEEFGVDKLNADGTTTTVYYKNLALDYLLVPGTKPAQGDKNHVAGDASVDPETDANEAAAQCKALVDITFIPNSGDVDLFTLEIPSVPIQRNYRTNIIGDWLAGDMDFEIVIEPEPDGNYDKEIDITADGFYYDKTKQAYVVASKTGLSNFASMVNSGTHSESRAASFDYTFSNKTVILDVDVDLEGVEWEPIGNGTNNFMGIFDGNGKTVSNFKVTEKTGYAGLFGCVYTGSVKNLTVKDVTIKANHYAGGIVGKGYVKIDNCHVENVNITLSIDTEAKDFGDKAGGIIGQNNEGAMYIKDCTAKNVSITGYRDLGGIVGMAHYGNTVSGNTVEAITIVKDFTNGYETQKPETFGAVIGRRGVKGSTTVTESGNSHDDDATFVEINGEEYKGYYKDAEGNYVVTENQGITNVINTEGAESFILADGEFTMPEPDLRGKTLTIKGSSDAVLDVTAVDERDQFVTGATLSFEGITLNFGKVNYMGFANTTSLTYKNCVINGLQFLYGENVTFENCDLNSNDAEHSVWTYGVKNVSFTDCDFTYSDRAVNCYSVSGTSHEANVTFTDCTFTKVAGKETTGAIETNSSTIKSLALNINNCTVNEGDLWWVSTWDSKDGENTVSIIDGKRIVTTSGQLKAAVAEGLTEINMTEGTFTMPTALSGKTIVLEGTDKEKTIIDMSNGSTAQYGAESVTFKNLTMKRKAHWLGGFSHSNAEHYEDCIIEGTLVTYAPTVTAKRTNFVPAATEYYNVHIYSPGTIKFEECNFRTTRGRSIYAHHDTNASTYDITINKCNFTTGAMEESDSQNQAAIRLHTEYGINGKLTINECTATGWKATHSGGLWVEWNNNNKEYTYLFEKVIDGMTIDKEGTVVLKTAAHLFWFANQVNVAGKTFSGKTVKLGADIDLENAAWTPVGQTGATQFKGTFDGQDKTISNLNIDATAQTGGNYSSGLFGWLNAAVVKNVKVAGATVKGNHNVAVIAGNLETSGCTVENCHVSGATVECYHKNSDACGDKAAIIVAYAGNAGTPVKNCTATNSTVKAGRDAGQIVGAAKEANVTDCSATNVTVSVMEGCNHSNAGGNIRNEVIGRLLQINYKLAGIS